MFKNFTLYTVVLSLLAFLLFSCKKDSKTISNNINIKDITTVKDSLLDGGGVRLFGQIKPDNQITDYGFEYGTDSLMNTFNKLSNGQTVQTNYQIDVIVGLVSGRKYFFRAYELVNGSEKWGDVKSFISQGSKPIIIKSITPPSACMLDTITVHGKNFDPLKTKAYFDTSIAQTLSINDSVLVCIIPNIATRYSGGISVKDNDNLRSTYANFTLPAPVITSFTDKKGLGDTVEIDGNNFDKAINFTTEVDFGTAKAQIVYTSKTKMLVIVPTFYYGSVQVKLTSQFQTVTAPKAFTVAPPVISGVPASAGILSFITITGKNFSPIYYYDYDQVFLNGTKADIFAGDQNSIKIQVPDAPYPNRTATVSVNVFGQIVNYTGLLNITDKWVMAQNNIPFTAPFGNSAFVVNGQAYALGISTPGQVSVYQFNPAQNTWSLLQSLPGLNGNWSSVTTDGSRVFIYSYGADGTGKFWEYIPGSQQLVAKTPFPGAVRTGTTMFYIGSTVYLGFGNNIIGYGDFYAYNTQTDSWKQVTGLSTSNFGGSTLTSFVIGNYGYVLYLTGGGSGQGSILMQYDAINDTWTKKSSVPMNVFYSASFVANGQGFVYDKWQYYKYDPVTDMWTKGSAIGGATTYIPEFGFTLGSKSYFGFTDNAGLSTYLYTANDSAL